MPETESIVVLPVGCGSILLGFFETNAGCRLYPYPETAAKAELIRLDTALRLGKYVRGSNRAVCIQIDNNAVERNGEGGGRVRVRRAKEFCRRTLTVGGFILDMSRFTARRP